MSGISKKQWVEVYRSMRDHRQVLDNLLLILAHMSARIDNLERPWYKRLLLKAKGKP